MTLTNASLILDDLEGKATALTSGVSWTLVVDSLPRRGPFPRHGQQVLVLADLMRSCGAEGERCKE